MSVKLLLILLIVASPVYAKTFEVNRKGHIYKFESSSSDASLNGKQLNFSIPIKKCSQKLAENLLQHFESLMTFKTTSPVDSIQIKFGDKTVFVPEGSKNGQKLIQFPDRFAKDFLVYKELCKDSKN